MSGIIRFYDNYQLTKSQGLHDHVNDSLKIALLTPAYAPCNTVGTRGPLLNQAIGDVVYSAAYDCYFVVSSAGETALGTPTFDSTPGALTQDGTVTWVSLGLAPPSEHTIFADVSGNEIVDAGYTAGGIAITQTLVLAGRRTVLNCSPIVWPNATLSAKYAVIYKDGTVGGLVNPLIAYILLDSSGASMSSFSGDFRIRFDADILYSVGGW